MTDAHCHVSCGDLSVRELLIGRDFFGIHPWETLDETTGTSRALVPDVPVVPDVSFLAALRSKLLANPNAGVGEIGLDRLKVRDIPPLMREVFESQLALALELRRPVVLHGAKCWGQVVAAVKRMIGGGLAMGGKRQAFLFHGFSRSDGLIPEIVELNGFISVGPAVLNDNCYSIYSIAGNLLDCGLLRFLAYLMVFISLRQLSGFSKSRLFGYIVLTVIISITVLVLLFGVWIYLIYLDM